MTSPPPRGDDAVVHQPRTIVPGDPAGPPTVVRPRTIPALGRPHPLPAIPPLESFADPAYHPPTGQVPVALDPELWTVGDEATPIASPRSDTPYDADQAVIDQAASAAAGAGTAGRVEPARLLRNNVLVATGTALSRATGLARTVLIGTFLATSLKDAYVLGNNTPNIIYELILGGVLTATLVPLFTDDLENGDGEATSAVISFTLVFLVAITAITALLSPLLMVLYATGSPHADQAEFRSAGIRLAVLFAPQVFFYGLMALWSAVLNARHRFFAAAWAPILNNILVIGALVATWVSVGHAPGVRDLLDRPATLLILGLGTSAGIAAMALSLYPALRRSGMRFRFRFQPRHPAVRRAVRLSAWTFGYVIANQIAVSVVSILAKPASGNVYDYTLAFQFFQLPHGLLAVSVMVTFEPLLGRAQARGDRKGFNDQVLLGFRLIGLLVIPAAAGYLALPKGLSYGIHPHPDTVVATMLHIGSIVAAFAVGLPGFSSYLYSFRAFYAMKDTRTPFLVNCLENGINVAAAIVFVRWWGVVGLALAYSLAYTVSAVLAVGLLARKSPGFDVRGLVMSWAKLLLAAITMGGFVFGFAAVIAPTTNVLLALTVLVTILLGAVTYFGAIYALDVPGISALMDRLPGFRKRRPPASTA